MSQHLYVPAAQGHRNRTSALAASSSSSLSIRLFPLSVDSPALQWTQIQTVPVLQRNKGWNSFFGTRRNRIYLECGSNSNLYPGPQTALCDVIKGTSLIVLMIRHNTVKFVLTNAFFSPSTFFNVFGLVLQSQQTSHWQWSVGHITAAVAPGGSRQHPHFYSFLLWICDIIMYKTV